VKVAAAKRELANEAKRLGLVGVTVEDDSGGDEVRIQVCAPDGKMWAEGPKHLVCSTYRGPQSWLDDVVKDTKERMSYGLRDAEDGEED